MAEIIKAATRDGYGKALVELGAINDKLVVLDADLAEATKTAMFKKAYPDRFFDTGIAECNMIGWRTFDHRIHCICQLVCNVRRRPCF